MSWRIETSMDFTLIEEDLCLNPGTSVTHATNVTAQILSLNGTGMKSKTVIFAQVVVQYNKEKTDANTANEA